MFCSLLLAAAAAHGQTTLPDAPQSHVPADQPHPVIIPKGKYLSGVVEPGQGVGPMTVRQKLLLPLHEELEWTTVVPILFTSEYGVLTNADPKYGSNGEAFAKRMGAEALYQVNSRMIEDAFLPILFHEDPRYYRQAYGTYESRTWHALRRTYITQSDSGNRTFNFSDILGSGMASALTQAYYPDRSVHPSVVFRSWGVSIAALAGGNLFEEFWPDVRARIFHWKP